MTAPPDAPDSAHTAARSAGLRVGSAHTDSAAGLGMHPMSVELAVAGDLGRLAWGIHSSTIVLTVITGVKHRLGLLFENSGKYSRYLAFGLI